MTNMFPPPDFKWLCEQLQSAGAKITFSRNCCSGIVSALGDGSVCQCWRCRDKRGQPADDSTEAAAAELSKRAQDAVRYRAIFSARKLR
jgi:hypothetical protein